MNPVTYYAVLFQGI